MLMAHVRSHLCAKRALEIAAVGNHTILLVGCRGVGKATLRDASIEELGPEMANLVTVADWCACGNWQAVTKPCTCDVTRLSRWQRRLKAIGAGVDMVIECAEVPSRELLCREVTQAEAESDRVYRLDRITQARTFAQAQGTGRRKDLVPGSSGARTMEMVVRRIAWQMNDIQRAMSVARTIADMGQSWEIEGKHIAEAVQYRYCLQNGGVS